MAVVSDTAMLISKSEAEEAAIFQMVPPRSIASDRIHSRPPPFGFATVGLHLGPVLARSPPLMRAELPLHFIRR